jgi:hypothetical protein
LDADYSNYKTNAIDNGKAVPFISAAAFWALKWRKSGESAT